MSVKKIQRFAEIKESKHVFEYTDYQGKIAQKPIGRWHAEIFDNSNPITLELACGKGAYTTSLARLHPERNYIGIDIKGARLWKGVKRAEEMQLNSVRFLRIYIDHLPEYFALNEVSEIWITFPDPYSRAGDRNKRLTSPRFLEMYKKILKPGGLIHFKTDDAALLEYTLHSIDSLGGTVLKCYDDIYRQDMDDTALTIQTSFEKKHLTDNKTIKYCKFLLFE